METTVQKLLSLISQAKPEMAVLSIPLTIVLIAPKLAAISITGTLILLGVLGLTSLVLFIGGITP